MYQTISFMCNPTFNQCVMTPCKSLYDMRCRNVQKSCPYLTVGYDNTTSKWSQRMEWTPGRGCCHSPERDITEVSVPSVTSHFLKSRASKICLVWTFLISQGVHDRLETRLFCEKLLLKWILCNTGPLSFCEKSGLQYKTDCRSLNRFSWNWISD